MNKIEIMSPVGTWENLQAAIQAGADSVYFGVEQLNMRRHSAKNFTINELSRIVEVCKKHNMKSYLTLNTIIYDNDIETMKNIINEAKKANISAIIACDLAAIQYAYSIKQEVHSSTQLNISNLEAVKFFSKYCDTLVLARELTIEQIKNICDEIKKQKIKGPKGELIKIEIFVHGALCVSISGKCYMSLCKHNCSANRGECMQPCRRVYRVIDDETGEELKLDNQYVMSPKDLCTVTFIDKIIESGVSVFKIEGRARAADYVYTVTKVYKEAVDSYFAKTYTQKNIEAWEKELETVFNRGFWQGGYYLGKKLGDWAGDRGSKATLEKTEIGKVLNYFKKTKIAHIEIINKQIKPGNDIFIIGPTTGILKMTIKEMYNDDKPSKTLVSGRNITIKVPEDVRPNDKIFLVKRKDKNAD